MSKILKWLLVCFALATILPYLWVRVSMLGDGYHSNVPRFLLSGGDYYLLRRKMPVVSAVLETKQMVPPGSRIMYSGGLSKQKEIFLRYDLYPSRVDPNWDFFLDWNNSHPADRMPPGVTVRRLRSGGRIFVKPGFMLKENQAPPEFPFLRLFLIFIAGVTLISLLGQKLLFFIGMGRQPCGRFWLWGMSYLSGSFIFCAVVWGYLALGGIFTQETVLVFLGSLSLVAIFLLPCGKIPGPAPHLRDEAGDDASSRESRRGERFSLFFLVAFLGILTLITLGGYVYVWDALTNWVFKAKGLYYQRGLFLPDPNSNYYPILWPVQIACFFALGGGDYDYFAQWLAAIALLAFASQIYGGFRGLGLKRQYVAFGTVFFLLVFYIPYFHCPLAENLFSAFTAGLIVSFIFWLRSGYDKRFLATAALMSFGMTATKMEGTIVVTLIFLSGVASRRGRLSFGEWCLVAGGMAACLIPSGWIFWLRGHDVPMSFYHISRPFTFESLLAIAKLVQQGILYDGYNGLLIFFAFTVSVLLFNGRKISEVEWFLLLASIALTLFSLGSFMRWPAADIMHYAPEALVRHMQRAVIPMAFFFCSRLFIRNHAGRADREKPRYD